MKFELIVIAITGFLIYNTYHDGKYTKILMSWKKYYQMAFFAIAGIEGLCPQSTHQKPNNPLSALTPSFTAASAGFVLGAGPLPDCAAPSCVLLRPPGGPWCWLGATPASTGRVGAFEHFRTPLGVFLHGPHNPDYRALGTVNERGIRGYGARGLRVFDFGWVTAERGWGRGGTGTMRLQVHATDPVRLEPRLGRAASKGCIRITAALNRFLDCHGLLDAEYDAAQAAGRRQWILRLDRTTIPWPGRCLVVVDSQRRERPAWSPLPPARL
jgi:hypothetical protein